MTITDSDGDLRPPDLLSGVYSPPDNQGRVALQSKLYSWTMIYGRVVRQIRDAVFLAEEEVEKLDEWIPAQYDKMPAITSFNPDSSTSPAPWYLDIHVFVDNTRLRVYRHNLTPLAPFASRLAALKRCVAMAKEASPRIAELFQDAEAGIYAPEDANQHNARVIRIVYPEHCLYLYSCAMYLVVAKQWSLALPFVIALRVIGTRLAINKCCCRYLWGVIMFTEERDSILRVALDEAKKEGSWRDQDEEVVALIAADMHQDARASGWEAVWQKHDVQKLPTLEVTSDPGVAESEAHDDSTSISETSDQRSTVKTPIITSEGESTPIAEPDARPSLVQRWSEDETWNAMVYYVRKKIEQQDQMEEEQEEEGKGEEMLVDTPRDGSDHGKVSTSRESIRDEIQRRMSISNLTC